MDEIKFCPSLDEVRKNKEQHGELVSCSYSVSSGGMMLGSDSLTYISAQKKADAVYITVSSKVPFGEKTTVVYKANRSALKSIEELIERENLAAWSGLRYFEKYHMTDVSRSAGISLTFDDTAIGGQPYSMRQIDLLAVRQQGGGEIEDEFFKLLTASYSGCEIVSEETLTDLLRSAFGVSTAKDEASQGCWVCRVCNYTRNIGRFCSECGSMRDKQ